MTLLRKIITLALSLTPIVMPAQTIAGRSETYPVSTTADGRKETNGFVSFGTKSDAQVFANCLVWSTNEFCKYGRDAILTQDTEARSFTCNWTFGSQSETDGKNVYHCKATFRAAGGKLLFTLSEIKVESAILVVKKITPMDKLQPETKRGHKEIIDDYNRAASACLNALFEFIETHEAADATHWNDIAVHKVVKGMTADEVLMSVGKPLSVSGVGEVQWKYSDAFSVFLQDGQVKSILK